MQSLVLRCLLVLLRLLTPQDSVRALFGGGAAAGGGGGGQNPATKTSDAVEEAEESSRPRMSGIAKLALDHAGKENEHKLLANMDRLPITGTKPAKEKRGKEVKSTRSWGVFAADNVLRRMCGRIAESRAFSLVRFRTPADARMAHARKRACAGLTQARMMHADAARSHFRQLLRAGDRASERRHPWDDRVDQL
eukprot:2033233-Rhodomonas_salina.2